MKLVPLTTVFDEGAATLVRDALAEQDIPVEIRRRGTGASLGLIAKELIDVCVPAERLEQARAALATLQQPEPPGPDAEEEDAEPRRGQRARRVAAAVALAVLFALLALCGVPRAEPASPAAAPPPLTTTQRAFLRGSARRSEAGWIFLRLAGEPAQRGFQYGYLAAREIAEALRVRRALWEYQSGVGWPWLVQQGQRVLAPRVPAELLRELDGLVQGLAAAGVATSRDELIAFNGFFELEGYFWPEEKKKLGSRAPDTPKQACSAFIATGRMTRDGNVVLGHNTMFPYPEADANLILDINPGPAPNAGHRLVMQAFPGWIHSGTDFFLSDAGLVGAETTIGGFHGFDEKGVAEFARFRMASQYAGSIDEWVARMKDGNNGGYANAWLLGDVRSGEIARLELGLRHSRLWRTKDGFYVGSNLAEDPRILRFETDERETDIRLSGVARRVRWKQLMAQHQGRIDVALAQRLEADHLDTFTNQEIPSARTLCSHAHADAQASTPFSASGTFDAKVVDSALARRMQFTARWGSACGTPFDAKAYLAAHPQFDWMSDILKSRPAQPWILVKER